MSSANSESFTLSGEGKGYQLQYSGLENSVDCIAHGVAKSQTRLSNFRGFPHSLVGKESTCNSGNPSSIPGLGRSPGEGNGYPLQYSGLENSMDCIVHGVTKSRTRLNDFHSHNPAILPLRVYSEEVQSLN